MENIKTIDILGPSHDRTLTVYDGLSTKQNYYVHWRLQGLTPSQAAKRTGYGNPAEAARENEGNRHIRVILAEQEDRDRIRYKIDRDRVVEGFMEAIGIAREMSDPKVMVTAWAEIAKVVGAKAPEVTRVEVTGNISHSHIAQASDAELLEVLGKYRELPVLKIQEDCTDVEESQ